MADEAPTDEDRLADLLKRSLKASGMSARQAAAQMDISDTRLRHIVNGYQPVGRGQRISTHAPTDTLARIADVLNITADELDQAGRPDAARELRERQARPDRMDAEWEDIQRAIQEWAEDPLVYLPPADMLRIFDDAALFGELERRIANLRGLLRGDARHGFHDSSFIAPTQTTPEGGDGNADADDAGGPAPTTRHLEVAADDTPDIEGEQEADENP